MAVKTGLAGASAIGEGDCGGDYGDGMDAEMGSSCTGRDVNSCACSPLGYCERTRLLDPEELKLHMKLGYKCKKYFVSLVKTSDAHVRVHTRTNAIQVSNDISLSSQ